MTAKSTVNGLASTPLAKVDTEHWLHGRISAERFVNAVEWLFPLLSGGLILHVPRLR